MNFSFERVNELLNACPVNIIGKNYNVTLTNEFKQYINNYFYKTLSIIYYVKHDNKLIPFIKKALDEVYLDKIGDKLKNGYVKHWFYKENFSDYETVCNPKRELVYEEDGKKKLNLFLGFMHKRKPFKDYPPEIKNKVKIMLDYIFDVLCSKKKEQYQYLLQWYSKVFKGEKNDTLIYLLGIQGIGKSTLTEFIRNYVLGNEIACAGIQDYLTGQFNKALFGKVLIIFEELPDPSSGEWKKISGKLKDMVTGSRMIYNEKNIPAYEAANLNNYVILSNDEAIHHCEGRRYFNLDVSTEHKDDKVYFGNIKAKCFNKEVGEAFFNYILEVDTTNFYSQNMPLTEAKKDAIVDNLSLAYKFLKDKYVLEKKGIEHMRTSHFYNLYKDYCSSKGKDKYVTGNTKFHKQIKDLGITTKIRDGYPFYTVTVDELKKIADKNNWLHYLDEKEENYMFVDEDEIEQEVFKPQIMESNGKKYITIDKNTEEYNREDNIRILYHDDVTYVCKLYIAPKEEEIETKYKELEIKYKLLEQQLKELQPKKEEPKIYKDKNEKLIKDYENMIKNGKFPAKKKINVKDHIKDDVTACLTIFDLEA